MKLKHLAPIGLLVLLLCNTFGLSFAILFFEKDYLLPSQTVAATEQQLLKIPLPSLPYSQDIEISGQIEALIRHDDQFYNPIHVRHTNDTLYITLQSNLAARDRFFELTAAMQMLSSHPADSPDTAGNTASKLLSDLIKMYVPGSQQNWQVTPEITLNTQKHSASEYYSNYLSLSILVNSPPPEHRS